MGVLETELWSSRMGASKFNHQPHLQPSSFNLLKQDLFLGLFKETYLEDSVAYTETKGQTHKLGFCVAQYRHFNICLRLHDNKVPQLLGTNSTIRENNKL